MDNNEEQLEEQPEMLDESIPYEEPQEQNNQSNNDGLLSGRNAYQNTLGNKDYYKDGANELNKQRNDLKKNHEEAPKNLEDAKKRQADAKKRQADARQKQEEAKDNGDKAEKKDAKKEANAAKKEANAAKKEQKQIKNNERHYKQNLRNNKFNQMTNKINAAKAKGYRARHPLEAGKDAVKEKGKQLAKQGAKKLGGAAKKGIQIIKSIPLPPHWKAIAIGVLAVIGMFFILLVTLIPVFAGDDDSDSSNGTAGSYSFNIVETSDMDFMCNMHNPLGEATYYITTLYGLDYCGDDCGEYKSGYRWHPGLDLQANDGSEVYAVADGQIYFIDWNGSAGNQIIIKHDNNYYTSYMHLKSFANGLKQNSEVKKGDVIGYQGGTGSEGRSKYSYVSHLDFRIYKINERGNSIDVNNNIFVGISDIGFDECISQSVVNNPTSEQKAKCVVGAGGSENRMNNKLNFSDICKSKSSYSSNKTSDDQNLLKVIRLFEGATTACTMADGKPGYTAEDIGDGTITVGTGFTNYAIMSYSGLIENSGYGHLFRKYNGKYFLINGSCIPKELADDLSVSVMHNTYDSIAASSKNEGINFSSNQLIALTSWSYQNGLGNIKDLYKAYKNWNNPSYSYTSNGTCNKWNFKDANEGIWYEMNQYYNPGTEFEYGLKKRRLTEFAIFVTGNYDDELNKHHNRNTSTYCNFYNTLK